MSVRGEFSVAAYEEFCVAAVKGFMAAAGITCSQRLGDVVSLLPALSEPEMVMLLGATS